MMPEVTFGKCQGCKEEITDHMDYYHCDKCNITKCSGCARVTIDPKTNEMVCSEQIDSDNLCGGFLGTMNPGCRIENGKMVTDNKTWEDVRREEQ